MIQFPCQAWRGVGRIPSSSQLSQPLFTSAARLPPLPQGFSSLSFQWDLLKTDYLEELSEAVKEKNNFPEI